MKNPISILCLILGLTVSMGFYFARPKVEITTAQCPNLITPPKIIEIKNGWKCEEQGSLTDLLQPSGLWINQSFSCWKLETPIEELRMQECVRTGDDYWCKKDSR